MIIEFLVGVLVGGYSFHLLQANGIISTDGDSFVIGKKRRKPVVHKSMGFELWDADEERKK